MKGRFMTAASAAAILLSGAGGAYAADLPVKAYKAPADGMCTSIVDFLTTACQVAAYGVRFYGTLDVGLGHMTNTAPMNPLFGTGYNYLPQKQSRMPITALMTSALSQSNVGIQVKEPLGAGWSFVGQLESALNANSFNFANNPASMHTDIGRTLGTAIMGSDGSPNGRFWNSLGFAGFSNDAYGTITFGRQFNVERDVFVSYDPVASQAFSLPGANGTFGGGGGSEQVRALTSVKYRVNFANFHFGVFGAAGDLGVGDSAKGIIQGDVGADFHVGPGLLSVDVAGGFTKDGVAEALSWGTTAIPATLASGVGNPAAPATGIGATISNNTSAIIAAKYNVDKLTVYGGYEWIQFAAPSDNITGFTDISGFQFGNGSTVLTVNTHAFDKGDKVLQMAWVGGKYAVTSSLDVAAGYYYLHQNDFSQNAKNPAVCAGGNLLASQCAGNQQVVSALIDWRFAPKWDTYLATQYTTFNGGLASGFLANNDWLTMAGLRFRW
jgi:predicted porin